MADTLWSRFWKSKRHPWNQPTYDPRKSVERGGVDVTAGGQIPLEVRTPYQISTDPRMMTGTGPGLAQVERPQYSGARPRGNIGGDAMGAAPRGKDFKNPLASAGSGEDENDKLLRMMFLQQLMAGAAGGDPPQPYTVQVGPASRDFVPLNMYGRGLA